jgi:pyruvate kinase
MKKVKIVATLGPSTNTPETISELFYAGADVFRLNFSHGTHEDHRKNCEIIRDLEAQTNTPIAVLADLQGPKLRVGIFENDYIELKAGDKFTVDLSNEIGTQERVNLPHPEIFKALEVGTELLMNDGRIRLKVQECTDNYAITEVITGGKLSNHKGVNVPNVTLPISALTDKDKKDLEAALEMGADWIALSFVQRPSDILEAQELIAGRAHLISKLEKPEAIDHLEDIIDLSDAIMIARGDLGVETPPESVPILQKRIIHACRESGKPVIVATQMLESMVNAPAPTRAEASDVATAVYDGTDAVMLSEETAAGQYPLNAVTIMTKIINNVETDPYFWKSIAHSRVRPHHSPEEAITAGARQIAETIEAGAIVTYTTSGSTTLKASRERPNAIILGLTPSTDVARMLCLAWGVHSVEICGLTSFSDIESKAIEYALSTEIVAAGDRLVLTAGIPFGVPGTTNTIRIATVK